MKLLAASETLVLVPALSSASANEAMRYGLDTIAAEKNPFWHRSPVVIWWDDPSPFAIYHRKAHPILGDFALLFEKPDGVPRSVVCNDDAFFDALLEDAVEVGVA
jgi:hypothetical protein